MKEMLVQKSDRYSNSLMKKKRYRMLFLYNAVLGVPHTSPYLKFASKDYSLNTYIEKHQINSRKLPNIPTVCITMKGLGVHFWAMTY